MPRRALTGRQQRVLTFLEDFSRRNGYPPTLREIGEAIGLTNVSAVRGHVMALEKKGYIERAADKARSIRIVHSPSPLSRLKRKLHKVLRTDEGVLHGIVYGLAWATWRRTPCLDGPARQWTEQAIEHEAIEHGWTIVEKRVEPDHVVVIVAVWPNHSAEQTVHRLQDAGRAARRRHRDAFPGTELWARGYVATTDIELLDELVEQFLSDKAERETD